MEAIKAQTIKVETNSQQAKDAQEVQQTRQKTVEWNQKNTLQLIRLWEQNTCLYDPGTKMFNNKFARCEALSRMVNLLKEDIPNLTIEDVQMKINSLRSQYLHEMARIQKHGKIEAASDKINVSSAYWFPSLQFLKPFVKPNKRNFEMMTKEERSEKRRNDHIAREKDRERKRAKRQNVAYRQMEQERDRERKKMLRSDTAFRSLEKIRDRMRKERKKFGLELDSSGNLVSIENAVKSEPNDDLVAQTLLEPEVIIKSEDVPLAEHFRVPQVSAISQNIIEPEVLVKTEYFPEGDTFLGSKVSTVSQTLVKPEVIFPSEYAPVGGNLLEPEVIISTNDYPPPQLPPYVQLPPPYNNNSHFAYGNHQPHHQF